MRGSLVLGSARELGTIGLVAALCGGYASALGVGSDLLTAANGAGTAVSVLLGAVATVFLMIALYVAAVVIANGVDTVLAGRLRHIAVLRLLGADARSLRGSVVRGTTLVGALGAVAGVVAGDGVAVGARSVLVAGGHLPSAQYTWFPTIAAPAALLVTAVAAIGAWAGSRAVLRASPAEALLGASVPPPSAYRAGVLRRWITVGLIACGSLLLAVAAVWGEQGGAGPFLVVAVGAMVTGTGVLVGARLIVPALVSVLGHLLGHDPASVVATRNALRDPTRTTRSTLGLVVGVTLVTTFAAGFAALRDSARSWDLSPAQLVQTERMLGSVSVIMVCVVVVSSVIAAVGFVSTMSLGVIQRTREIGLLRALGFTSGQVRTMIAKESVVLSVTAVGFGIALGLVYGALGAQALVGFETRGFVWGVPLLALAAITGASVLLVLAASWIPSSRAVAVTPVEALRTT